MQSMAYYNYQKKQNTLEHYEVAGQLIKTVGETAEKLIRFTTKIEKIRR